MEDQKKLSNPLKIRTSARPSTPATKDNKKKSQLSYKKNPVLTRQNKKIRSDDEMSKTHKQNKQLKKLKNIKTINKTTQTTTKSPYSNTLWNQNKYELETCTKPKF